MAYLGVVELSKRNVFVHRWLATNVVAAARNVINLPPLCMPTQFGSLRARSGGLIPISPLRPSPCSRVSALLSFRSAASLITNT